VKGDEAFRKGEGGWRVLRLEWKRKKRAVST